MKSQTQRPTLRDRGRPRSGRGVESFLPPRSLALSAVEGFTLSSKKSAKSVLFTPFFSMPPFHWFTLFFALAKSVLWLPTLTRSTPLPKVRKGPPQNAHDSSHRLFLLLSVRSACPDFVGWHSFPSVAANSPRCHTFFSSAARIVADDTIVRLGCANWGLYGIA